ncbi:MAG: LacI family transcriptional regulator [Ruminococcaceae bacterium]|nr:LacI family transcriptional regulator [Oscillospiraceae bacterium]
MERKEYLMKNDITGEVAEKLGISRSTVGKAYRHCSGVDSETRQQILDEIAQYDIHDSNKCDIYCIIPDNPQFFWQEMRRGLRENLSDAFVQKFNIITKINDEDTVVTYLKEAERMRASVIIITARLTPRIRAQLTDILSKGRTLVILLSEYDNLANSFYIGSDSYTDGIEMGKTFVSKYSSHTPLILSIKENKNAAQRTEGFLKSLSDGGIHKFHIVEISADEFKNEKLAPARVASMISPYKTKTDCIYSPIGFIKLPLAAHKAGFSEDTIILSHDCFTSNSGDPLREEFCVTLNQDIYTQGKEAISAAEKFIKAQTYPDKKITYIPSIICR